MSQGGSARTGLEARRRWSTSGRRALLALTLLAQNPTAFADGTTADAPYQYRLLPRAIAPDVYVVEGSTEHFNLKNGGNILNTGFIVTPEGVVVFDTGPSLRYGQALRAAITEVAGPKPVLLAINSHQHPDHVLGNAAFEDVPIGALDDTRRMLDDQGEDFLDNMYRLLGPWMNGTTLFIPGSTLIPTRFELGGRRFEIFALAGHSEADLALLDVESGVLFCGDICFHERAPTTPNADIPVWQAALAQVESIGARQIVPGHGPVFSGQAPLGQVRDYLDWLAERVEDGAWQGHDMAELMFMPLPERFADMHTLREEYQRSVMHLFPAAEAGLLDPTRE